MNLRVGTKARAAFIAVAALAVASLAIWTTGKSIPSLVAPIRLKEAYALADGGSVHLIIQDAVGREFVLGVVGSLEEPPNEFSVYVQRWYPWVPVPFTLARRSQDEKLLLSALGQWVSAVPQESNEAKALGHIQVLLRQRNEIQGH